MLGKIGVAPAALRVDIDAALAQLPTLASEAEPTTAPELALLITAEKEMRALKDGYVSVEHLLLALAKDDGPAGKAMIAGGATHARLL